MGFYCSFMHTLTQAACSYVLHVVKFVVLCIIRWQVNVIVDSYYILYCMRCLLFTVPSAYSYVVQCLEHSV